MVVDAGTAAPAPAPQPTRVERVLHAARAVRWRLRRRRVVRQYDQVDCGPAALLTVLRYWGGDHGLVHVRESARTGAGGSSLLGLCRAAESLGFDAKGAAGEYDDLREEQLPAIAHLVLDDGMQHFVVVYAMDDHGVSIGDPAKGRRRMSRGDFERQWRSRSVLLLRPTDRLARVRPPSWLRWLASYFRHERTWLLQSLFLGASATVLGLTVAVFIQMLVDRFIPAGDAVMILATGLVLLAMLILRAAAGYLRQRFVVHMNRRVGVRVNRDFLTHLFRLPLGFFESRKTGDITSRVADSVRIQNAMMEIAGTAVIDGLVVLGSVAFLFVMAAPLAWVALATTPLYAALLVRATRRLKAEQNEVMEGYARVEASYIDSLSGVSTVLGFNAGSTFTGRNAGLYESFQKRAERLGLTRATLGLVAELAGGLLVVASLIWGAWLVIDETLLLGQMVAGYSLLAGMLPSVDRLVRASVVYQEAAVAATRLMDMLLVPAETPGDPDAAVPADGVAVLDARFAWPNGAPLFDGLTLEVPAGRVTGLWGPSGVGKSTLVRILNRTWPLDSGRLRAGNRAAEDIDLAAWRRQVAIVGDDVKIFSGTLADNVVLGRPIADPDARLARLAGLDLARVLGRFPQGWTTRVGEEGRRLSAGERQLVGLLRGVLDEPAVLLVDEALGSADVELARAMLDAVTAYGREHAVLVVSHDLRVLMHTDHLYLLGEGRVQEQGPPGRLVDTSPRLARLWSIQHAVA